MTRNQLSTVIAILLSAGCVSVTAALPRNQTGKATAQKKGDSTDSAKSVSPKGDEFEPVRLLGEFEAIRNAPVLAAEKVRDEVRDHELVIGVVVDGKARAYPINMLTGPSREIINDTVGKTPIAATW